MKKILKKLDSFLDRKWKETCSVIFCLAGVKVEEDIDWLNMHNNMIEENKNERL